MALLNVTKTMLTYRPMYKSTMTVVVSEQDKNILVTTEATEKTNLAFQKVLTNKKSNGEHNHRKLYFLSRRM